MRRRTATVLVAIVATLVLAACDPRTLVFDGSRGGAVTAHVLTADGTDRYAVTANSGTVDVAPLPTNVGQNLREVVWPSGVAALTDGETCATWSRSQGQLVQQGAAFRIRLGPGSRVRAVTVTQNIYFLARYLFNVHVWDTSQEPPMQLVGQVDLSRYFGTPRVGPYRFCAKVVGRAASFRIWTPASEPEPAWDDGVHGGTVVLPASSVVAGRTGWVVGHLAPGDAAAFSDLFVWSLDPSAA